MMKFYAEVLPKSLGRVIYRINHYLRKFAPGWASFVTDPAQADAQILDVIGIGSLAFVKSKNLILLQHCFLSSESSDHTYWYPLFRDSKLVVSYMDLQRLMGDYDFNFLRVPWGVDPSVFFSTEPKPKLFNIASTGYVSSTESIEEAYRATRRVNGNLINIGKDFRFGTGFSHKEGISDEELRKVYEASSYVVGLRKMEGFELPVIEGLLSGARGICYNADHYKYWFGDLVEYIEEDPQSLMGVSYSKYVEDQIFEILARPYRPVTTEEKEKTIVKFCWEVVMKHIWDRIGEAVNDL